MFAFPYVKVNSKEICKEIHVVFPIFWRKMLMSAFLLGYPYFSLWIPIALAKKIFVRDHSGQCPVQYLENTGLATEQSDWLILVIGPLN